ncbi:sigma-70 family RNA polymerase sigma factor [Rhizobium sp. P32RR-XVIII]|uniref:sigma-70 family RNA polymerase sigma factor n=1 Tax=Rhizobium sp. P32RR-XVIII TaxID=2726738 RepID=UPI0014566526|nr:sigma-70 family RNA polymerase sigma factor [Rhizobium sp. P32RR-XVIII]NLS04587.1 sigma-70 family RNA polymerase sigma factor [Rhizobium sp. P32RR-XVIII]
MMTEAEINPFSFERRPFAWNHHRPIALAIRAAALLVEAVSAAVTMSVETERSSRDAKAAAHMPAASTETMQRFRRTILPHLDDAYNFARFLSRDADAAGDIVQEAFLRAYRGFEGYRGGDPRAWTFAIVRNCYRAWLLDGRQKARFEVPMAEDAHAHEADSATYQVPSDDDTPEMSIIRRSEAERVRQVIGALSDPMREVLVLRELEGLSYRQIAEIIDAPIGTVMSRLARARDEFGNAWLALEKGEAKR